jgi:hypothetical protein
VQLAHRWAVQAEVALGSPADDENG